MTVDELKQLLTGSYDQAIEKITKLKPAKPVPIADVLKQLDPSQHAVFDIAKRPDKLVITEDEDGNETSRIEPVARLAVSFQKRIVNVAASFLCGNPIQLESDPQDELQTNLLAVLQRTWDDNKLDYESLELAATMMGETECAELWYAVPVEKEYWQGTENEGARFRYRFITLAPSKGDTLYPVFDNTGDMIGFGRGYFIQEGDEKVEHFDFYTDTTITTGTKAGGNWTVKSAANVVGKIPVIFYSQPLPEWSDVETLIERIEDSLSGNADTNDYNGSPILAIEGEVKGLSTKGERGKVVELQNGANAKYLVWPNAPEAIKLEFDTLLKLIHSMTSTPDISFDQMKGIGPISGVALRLLFMDAHMKSARKEGIFGKGVQRRLNFLKTAIAKANVKFEKAINLVVKPKFEYFLPKNFEEMINMLTTATGNGKAIMSQATATKLNPLVSDPESELEAMEEEGVYGSDIETA